MKGILSDTQDRGGRSAPQDRGGRNGTLDRGGRSDTLLECAVERHPFEPFLPEGARMLFLGSFPPQPHRWCMPFYYPNWINDFWRIMGLIHFGDKDHFCLPREKRFDEAAIRQFCADAGLAFYDTACEVRRLRDNASDAFLEVVTPSDIPALLERIPCCRMLITTGEKATSVVAERFGCPIPAVGEYVDIDLVSKGPDGLHRASLSSMRPGNQDCAGMNTVRRLRFWRMPSSSRAYPLPLERKAEYYRRLFF